MKKEWIINNQYSVVELIGTGDIATVYKAWDSVLKKFVAVKKIHKKYSSNKDYMEAFNKYAVNAAKLEHENIVRLINYIKDDSGNLYVVMDYIKGVSLDYFIEKCKRDSIEIPVEISLYIISEIIKALDYAHTVRDEVTEEILNIIHRNIYPGNIILYFDGRIRLADFAIAGEIEQRIKTTERESLGEKISYMSPEQIEGENNIDKRSDIFSCGAVMYEILTGQKAIVGNTDLDIWQKVLNVNIDFSKLNAGQLSPEIQSIVKKTLQKSPEKRYKNSAEMFLDIKRYLNNVAPTMELTEQYKDFIKDLLQNEIRVTKEKMDKDLKQDLNVSGVVKEDPRKEEEFEEIQKEDLSDVPKSQELQDKSVQEESREEYSDKESTGETEVKITPDETFASDKGFDEEPVMEPEEAVSEKEPEVEVPGTKEPEEEEEFEPAEDDSIHAAGGLVDDDEKEAVWDKPSVIYDESERMQGPGIYEPPVSRTYYDDEFADKSSEDKDKTVFDFVLDTAKKYRKVFISVVIAIIIAFINFTILDTYMQFTEWGIKIHNIVWPPALKIDTVPSNARIELVKGSVDIIEKNGYKVLTPSYIEKIQPGLYTLRVIKEGYGEMVRRVTVFGKQHGQQAIAVAGGKVCNGIHVVPFEVELEINSVPENTELYIDGKKVGQTPFKGQLEIGHHNFYLLKEGFEALGRSDIGSEYNPKDIEYGMGICLLDTSKSIEDQTAIDYRFWQMKEAHTQSGGKKYVITGSLWKRFSVTSIPEGAEVYINDAPISDGTTPIENLILMAGKHKIKMKKKNYITWEGEINVSADAISDISTIMKKEITIHAYKAGSSRKDLGASVKIVGTNIKGKTPLTVTLPHGRYVFKMEKPPAYQSAKIKKDIGKIKDKLYIKMKLRPPHLTLKVKDYTTGKKIKDATVWVGGNYWRRTDSKGIASDYIYEKMATNEFDIEVKADKYDDYRTVVKIAKGQRKKFEVTLGVPKDGKIIIEVQNKFLGTSVYLDGEYVGEDSQIISNVPWSYHNVEFRFNNINKTIVEKVKTDKSNKILILKVIQQENDIMVVKEQPFHLEIEVKDFKSGKAVEAATVFVNDKIWARTSKTGSASGYIEEQAGELKLKIQASSYEDYKLMTYAERNKWDKKQVTLGVPKDGTLVIDIPENIYESSFYLDGEYKGDNVSLVSNIARTERIIEIKAEQFKNKVVKKIKFSKPNQLIMLRLIREGKEYYLQELNPETYLENSK